MTDATGTDLSIVQNAQPGANGLIELPLLPLAGTVIFPHTVLPLTLAGREGEVAVRMALANGTTAISATLRDPASENLKLQSFHPFGTEIALRDLPELDDMDSVLAQGRRRVQLVSVRWEGDHVVAEARIVAEPEADSPEAAATVRTVVRLLGRVIALNPDLPEEALNYVRDIRDVGQLADIIASMLDLTPDEDQTVLSTVDPAERLKLTATLLGKELTLLELEEEIETQVQQGMDREQREIYLREQMRVIQSELGEGDILEQENEDLRRRITEAELPREVYDKAMNELSRLALMPPMAPEIGLVHTYIDWLVSVPWNKSSDDNLDLLNAQQVLDADHYGLPRVKDRVLEHIAVRKLAADAMQTPILCFLGPPGTGKTSLGKSIARALGREFVRVSLGGVRDEAEIRGHRRTYIGALPGRIIQTMRRAGTVNPVMMLDEIDKMGYDFRGDPAAALLEVLDPEQNADFVDHYLDVPYDLSQVLFITTANDLYPLSPALEDRLEVIEFPGYIEEEKLEIAQQFLIPNQLKAHGLTDSGVKFESGALQEIVRDYTYEAGVRNLKRRVAEALRKVARQVAEGKKYPRRIKAGMLPKLLGPPDYMPLRANDKDEVGVVTGLAWTSSGGEVTLDEVILLPGKGTLMLTGQLGDVMQESAQAAMSYMRARADDFDVPHDDFENYDVHVHLPAGAVPKDGPSAGVTLATAIISVFTERPVRSDYAMTGEITLRGKVLPVGGIREKVMAAHRARIFNLLLPKENEPDLVLVPKTALRDMNITFIDDMQQVIDAVLLAPPPDGRIRDANSDDEEESDSEDDS